MQNPSQIRHGWSSNLGPMNIRSSSDRRASWRQRFVAIARQFESAAERAQDLAGVAGVRVRPRGISQGPSRRIRAAA